MVTGVKHTYTHIYILGTHIYTYIAIDGYVCIYMHVYISVRVCVCISACVLIWTYKAKLESNEAVNEKLSSESYYRCRHNTQIADDIINRSWSQNWHHSNWLPEYRKFEKVEAIWNYKKREGVTM